MHRSTVVSVLARPKLVQHSSLAKALFFAMVLMLASAVAFGQQLTGGLSGTVYDQAGSVVPNAKVDLTNETSGDVRHSVTNTDGYFSFTAIPPANYRITITANGFQPWEEKNIAISQGDTRTLPNIALAVGSVTQQVEVISASAAVAPVDTGEVSASLNTAMVNDISLQGRDAGELLRIMPGMAVANGLSGQSSFNDHSVSSNQGPVGAYSANGTQPNGAMAYMLDGANLVDPGNVGTQIANVNQDMTSEVKVLMSSYGAEYAKGPVVFEAFGKSGGHDFHGEAYFYARDGVLDSLDSGQKAEGAQRSLIDPEHFFYPGANIGGPVLIPFTHINRNRNKLFFWFGYEYMNQAPAGSVLDYVVPTAQMLQGNFSAATLAPFSAQVGKQWNNSVVAPSCNATLTPGACVNGQFPGGIIPSNLIDPGGLALLKLLPQPNIDPATHNGFNYQYVNPGPVGQFLTATNRWEQSEKIDYNITDNTKLTVSYTYQKELDDHPIATWWSEPSAVPYPSNMPAETPSHVLMANFTHVFSPSLVNETVFTYARYVNDLTLSNASAVNPANVGLPTQGLFGITEKQIPNTLSWSNGLAEFMPQADFYSGANGIFGATKSDPAIYDNLSKVIGSHTMKFGFYWDQNQNNQVVIGGGNEGINGLYEFETYNSESTGNLIADELLGRVDSYAQSNNGPFQLIQYHQIDGYAQDSWKVSKRLTINYGLRMSHVGQYYDPNSKGFPVFNPAVYVNTPNGPTNTGIQTHATNSNIPVSGLVSPFAYPEPRVGIAFDIFGNGKTVIRTGFAQFKYQVGVNAPSAADNTASGGYSYTSGQFIGIGNFSSFTNLPTGKGALNGGNITVEQMGESGVPTTNDWNFSIDQALPWHSLFELSYVGNHSFDLLLYNDEGFNNPNQIPVGSFFKPDPRTGGPGCTLGGACPSGFNANDYFPLVNYQNIYEEGSSSQDFANYNSVQASFQKQTGPALLFVNYTFGKVLGIRDNFSGNGPSSGSAVDTLCISCNYGILAYNHTNIFNATYILHAPSPVHSNAIMKGVVNGWILQGYTMYQSGAPIQPNTGGTLNVAYPGNISNQTWLGTNQVTLVPLVTCDPRKGLSSGQYFNPSCFTIPPPGTNGTLIWPNITGPGFFDSDLSIYKDFRMGEQRKIQFRASAFNFLNHANPTFGAEGQNNDITLRFNTAGQNINTLTNGKPLYSIGTRVIEFSAKFYF